MARKYKYLTHEQRLQIEKWYKAGERPVDIAARLGIHTATIYHELQKGYTGRLDKNQRNEYSADKAQTVFFQNLQNRGRKTVSETKTEGVRNDII